MDFFTSLIKAVKFQSKKTLPQTNATFKDLAEAMVPYTHEPVEKNGAIQSFGALDAHLDEYLIWSLNHILTVNMGVKIFKINLANVIAETLNIAAEHLIYLGQNEKPVDSAQMHEVGTFAALAPIDRFRAITLLEEKKVDSSTLPIPYRIKPAAVLSTIVSTILLGTIGYYTEWSGYGSTRLETPEKRRLEHFPIGWEQAGYPGPSRGYHALRGFLIAEFTE